MDIKNIITIALITGGMIVLTIDSIYVLSFVFKDLSAAIKKRKNNRKK